MNLENLKLYAGASVKNYRALCELLEEPVKTGKSKMLQLNEWGRFFKFEREDGSQCYWIETIYEEPKEKIDKRSMGNRSTYAHAIRALVLSLLIDDETKCYYVRDWLLKVGLINPLFCFSYGKNCIENEELTYDRTKDMFRGDVRRFGAERFRTAVRYLISKEIILFKEYYIIEENIADIDEPQDIITRPITKEEESFLRDVERRVLNEFGFEQKKDVAFHGKSTEFYKRMEKIIKEECPEWTYYAKVWEIKRGKNFNAHAKKLSSAEIKELKRFVNKLFADYLSRRVSELGKGRPTERIIKAKIGPDRVEALPDYSLYFSIYEREMRYLIDKYTKI